MFLFIVYIYLLAIFKIGLYAHSVKIDFVFLKFIINTGAEIYIYVNIFQKPLGLC